MVPTGGDKRENHITWVCLVAVLLFFLLFFFSSYSPLVILWSCLPIVKSLSCILLSFLSYSHHIPDLTLSWYCCLYLVPAWHPSYSCLVVVLSCFSFLPGLILSVFGACLVPVSPWRVALLSLYSSCFVLVFFPSSFYPVYATSRSWLISDLFLAWSCLVLVSYL